jgi:hypothetical protein
MTDLQIRAAVKNELAVRVPAILIAAGLPAMVEYVEGRPLRTTDNELAVYIGQGSDTTSEKNIQIIIQIQLVQIMDELPHKVEIGNIIEEYITPRLVNMVNRESIDFDNWPPDLQGSAFVYFYITFSSELDDDD